MKLSINDKIFLQLNSMARKSFLADKVIVFFAKYLIFLFIICDGILLVIPKLGRSFGLTPVKIYLFNLVGALTWLLMLLIKRLHFTPRPYVYHSLKNKVKLLIRKRATSAAFPSGHTALISSIGGGIFYISPGIGSIVLALALIVGTARVIAGIHWPIDILGGAVLGCFLSFLVFGLFF